LIYVHQEEDNLKEVGTIIRKYSKGENITAKEEHLLKLQLVDTLKIVGIVVPYVLLQRASIVVTILLKVVGKHNINLMPSVV